MPSFEDHYRAHASEPTAEYIASVRPTTGSELTTGNMARLAASTAATLAKANAMADQLVGLSAKLDELAADLAVFKAERARNDESAAAIARWRSTQ
jgi:hypothetical protein